LRYHPYFYDVIATTSKDGIHIFRPNFSPEEEEQKDTKVMDDIVIKEEQDLE